MYTHIKNSDDLKASISELKQQERTKRTQLTTDFNEFTESIKPINLIKSSIHKITSSPGLGGKVLKGAMGLGVGLLSNKVLPGKSSGIFKRLAGQAVKLGLAGVLANKSDKIKYTGLKFLTKLLGKKKEKET